MTFNNFLPPKTWFAIAKLADENNLSTKEVERIILNKTLFELGMECPHRRIGYKDGKPYCKDCWTRFTQTLERVYNPDTKKWTKKSKFIPLDTFLDEFYKDKGAKYESEVEAKVKAEFWREANAMPVPQQSQGKGQVGSQDREDFK